MIYLYGIGIDCAEPEPLAKFWRRALEYDQRDPTPEEMEEAYRRHPKWRGKAVVEDRTARHPRLRLERVPEPKAGRNRVRFEVGVPSRDLEAETDRLAKLGAMRLDAECMADPEGNEFGVCGVDGPRRFTWIVIDALDPARQALFWSQTFGWVTGPDRCTPPDDWLRMEGGALIAYGRKIRDGFPGDADPPDGPVHTLAPGLRFDRSAEPKKRKNRVHLDLVFPRQPDITAAERARVVSLGASLEDPTSGHRGMFDPEGNEFCLH